MVCAYCGTLNADDMEKCGHCGRALAATGAECCARHPDRWAVARCARCDILLCDECDVLVNGTAYCAEHAEAVQTSSADALLEATPVLHVAEQPVATFAQRVQAGVIDVVLIGIASFIVYLALWAVIGSPPDSPDAGVWRPVFDTAVVLGAFMYLAIQGFSSGQTVGKMWTDIIVLCEDGTLMPARLSFLRTLLAFAGFALGGIGFWYILFDPRCRALHDRLLGTIVVHE